MSAPTRAGVNVCAATVEEQAIQGHSECEKSHATDPTLCEVFILKFIMAHHEFQVS
jgi:hypothetical protein